MTGLNRYSGLSVLMIFLANACLGSRIVITEIPAGKDTSKTEKHALYAGAGFGSNMVWLGSTISNDLPYYSGSLTYGYKGALFLSGSASVVTGFNMIPSFYSLTATFNHTFNDWFDISLSSAGYKTRAALRDTLFSDFGYFNFTAGFDWNILYTRLSISDLTSAESKGYLQIINSRYFETADFFNGNANVSFNPEFSLLTGEITRITTSAGTIIYQVSPPFKHGKHHFGSTTPPMTTYDKFFGVLNFELALPVDFNYKNLDVGVEPGYIFPALKDKGYLAPHGFYLYISALLKIF